ncbi:MAG: 4-(cytidine 5'-diphospho)-2-C-methyl-D-erythritol kinase [Ruminococcaceae bacterium]|nr:4-(cytidine 5'-diphospho)-2-C-methyl-D-erythritol kinase [Oscillospiraceae bacterium]
MGGDILISNETYTEKAYAKINLYLDVTAKRSDGFHDIFSVMQAVSLYDEISVTVKEETKDSLTCNISSIPTDKSNLAIKALDAFRAYTKSNFGAEIHIQKNIPSSAGLAGGSSDAGAVLRTLNKLTNDPVSNEELLKIGASIGADVPFCLLGGTMIATGKGEILKPISKCPQMHCVIAINGEGVSTPKAYSMLDEKFGDFSGIRDCGKQEKLLNALEKSDVHTVKDNLFNIFESVIEPERPEITKIKGIMKNTGAIATLMSGSGPSVFGIFNDKSTALEAQKILSDKEISAFYCTT